MRLIALDEFLRQNCIDRMEGKSCEECKHHVLVVTCEQLMEQPTIDPVKHGRWIEREVIDDRKDAKIPQWQSAKCSVCGKYHTTPYLYYFDHFKYCPDCGALMDEVTE